MTLFLFVKQIVDMLYQYRSLDYLMVIWVLFLLIYQIALVRPCIKDFFSIPDVIILLFVTFLTIQLFDNHSGYQVYFKVLSALLMYFVGRIYYDRIKECYTALVSAAYIIVYFNFFIRIWKFGWGFLGVTNANGDLYFYDTDMAFAMLLAMVFIAMLGKNSVRKMITILAICPYMIICSDAGIQAILLVVIFNTIVIFMLESMLNRKTLFNCLLILEVIGLLGLIALIYWPVLNGQGSEMIVSFLDSEFLNLENMHVRYSDWNEIVNSVNAEGIFARMFGIGLGADISVNSLYIKVYYSLGYIGICLTVMLITSIMYYVAKIEDRKTYYLAVIMAILLFGTGVTVNSMETTQMSWFPLLFAGMVVSSVRVGTKNEYNKE